MKFGIAKYKLLIPRRGNVVKVDGIVFAGWLKNEGQSSTVRFLLNNNGLNTVVCQAKPNEMKLKLD